MLNLNDLKFNYGYLHKTKGEQEQRKSILLSIHSVTYIKHKLQKYLQTWFEQNVKSRLLDETGNINKNNYNLKTNFPNNLNKVLMFKTLQRQNYNIIILIITVSYSKCNVLSYIFII